MFHNLDAVLQIMEYIVLLIGTVIYNFNITESRYNRLLLRPEGDLNTG